MCPLGPFFLPHTNTYVYIKYICTKEHKHMNANTHAHTQIHSHTTYACAGVAELTQSCGSTIN